MAVIALWLSACAHAVERRDWSAYKGPGASHFQREEVVVPNIRDPLEPWNRSVSALNRVLVVGVLQPASRVYRFLVPRYLRDRLKDFGANLLYPRRLATNLLQGKTEGAWDETRRFGINTTLGVLGFWDRASERDIPASVEDFGQTFAVWGWSDSTFVTLPLLGPSTVRDGVGLIPDALLNPATYFFPASPVLTFNEVADQVPVFCRFLAATFDPYRKVKLVWSFSREQRQRDYDYQAEDGPAVQTLQSIFLDVRDPAFPDSLRAGWAITPATGRGLPYSYRLQPEPAPLLFIAPGLGGHRLGRSTLALAEMAWSRGFSVAIVSSALNPEFMRLAASTAVPGHAPVDARDLHRVLQRVAERIDEDYPRRVTRRALLGYSLGAFHALFIAASEADPDNEWITFDRYVTIDAPVSLFTGLEKLDAFFNAPLVFPPSERAERIDQILLKTLEVVREGADGAEGDVGRMATLRGETDFAPHRALPFSNLEAEFLIGLAFRLALQDIIWVSQEREDLGVLLTPRSPWRRWAAYQEIGEFSYSEYMYAFVLWYYRDRLRTVRSARELVDANDLRSIAAGLRASGKIRHFANSNDFLTTDADIEWLTETLGADNVRFYTRGGHLGNLFRPEVQSDLMAALEDLL